LLALKAAMQIQDLPGKALADGLLCFVLFLGGCEQGSFFRCRRHAILRAGTAVGHRGEQTWLSRKQYGGRVRKSDDGVGIYRQAWEVVRR
jgi:hypothetical protein